MTGQSISLPLAKQLLERFQTRQNEVESFIRALVETESPSGDANGSRAVVDLIENAARNLACVGEVERVNVADFGQHLVIKAFQEQSESGEILIVGHTDTVHSRGSLAERPWRREAE